MVTVHVKTVSVSCCHCDSDFVDRLILDLRVSEISATYDKWFVNVGDSIIEKIVQAVTNADGVIAINDADCLRKYLSRFGLEWSQLSVTAF